MGVRLYEGVDYQLGWGNRSHGFSAPADDLAEFGLRAIGSRHSQNALPAGERSVLDTLGTPFETRRKSALRFASKGLGNDCPRRCAPLDSGRRRSLGDRDAGLSCPSGGFWKGRAHLLGGSRTEETLFAETFRCPSSHPNAVSRPHGIGRLCSLAFWSEQAFGARKAASGFVRRGDEPRLRSAFLPSRSGAGRATGSMHCLRHWASFGNSIQPKQRAHSSPRRFFFAATLAFPMAKSRCANSHGKEGVLLSLVGKLAGDSFGSLLAVRRGVSKKNPTFLGLFWEESFLEKRGKDCF